MDQVRIDNFYHEVQFYLKESVYPPENDIIQVGDKCNSIIFIVNGLVDIEVVDAD